MKFIPLRSALEFKGEIRADSIIAIRLGDYQVKEEGMLHPIPPRVIIDYAIGDGGNCVIVNCMDDVDRQETYEYIMKCLTESEKS